MIYHLFIATYLLITLLICVPAATILRRIPKISGDLWMLALVLLWPLLAVVGFAAHALGYTRTM